MSEYSLNNIKYIIYIIIQDKCIKSQYKNRLKGINKDYFFINK